jgi:hypothetical protein
MPPRSSVPSADRSCVSSSSEPVAAAEHSTQGPVTVTRCSQSPTSMLSGNSALTGDAVRCVVGTLLCMCKPQALLCSLVAQHAIAAPRRPRSATRVPHRRSRSPSPEQPLPPRSGTASAPGAARSPPRAQTPSSGLSHALSQDLEGLDPGMPDPDAPESLFGGTELYRALRGTPGDDPMNDELLWDGDFVTSQRVFLQKKQEEVMLERMERRMGALRGLQVTARHGCASHLPPPCPVWSITSQACTPRTRTHTYTGTGTQPCALAGPHCCRPGKGSATHWCTGR